VIRTWTGRLLGALIALLLVSGWRPSTPTSIVPVLRSTAKGPRRSPSELPEASMSRFRKREGERAPLANPALLAASEEESVAFVSPSVRAKVSDGKSRPRYLQPASLRDAQSALAPPSA
jgi:hypothetical protein